jgi:hypothetical protein
MFNLSNYAWNRVDIQFLYQVHHEIKRKTSNRIWDWVWNQVGQLRWQGWSKIRNHVVRNQSKGSAVNVYNTIWDQMCYGQQDAYRLAFYSYIMQVLRIEIPKLFIPYILLAQEVNWVALLEETIFVTRKPKECIFENNKFVKIIFQDNYTIT